MTHVGTVPFEAGTAINASRHGDLLFVTAWRSFSVYDVSAPTSPQLLSTTPVPGQLFNEEPQTNGEVLLLSHDQQLVGELDIYDVTDPRAPEKIATYPSPRRDHIWACVFDCRYAYGSDGTILDLADPSRPTMVGDWTDVAAPERFHDINEVAPGVLMTGSAPAFVLDARQDPARPTVLARFDTQHDGPQGPDTALPARADWPRTQRGATPPQRPAGSGLGFDRFALVSTETPFTGPCQEDSGGFATYDTRGWEETGTFTHVDDYRITTNGTYTDGKPPYNVLGCTAYAFDTSPTYGDERLVAVAWFEHGLRLLSIDGAGAITEIGGFVPHAGASAEPVWITDEVLYVIDLQRGIDILRVDR